MTAADLDGDGDLATANFFSDDVTILINQLDPVTTPCPADTNNDNTVGPDDLFTLLANFGTTTTNGPTDGDVSPPPDGDGQVTPDDLFLLLSRFGTNCP